jgi:hypothetical protein
MLYNETARVELKLTDDDITHYLEQQAKFPDIDPVSGATYAEIKANISEMLLGMDTELLKAKELFKEMEGKTPEELIAELGLESEEEHEAVKEMMAFKTPEELRQALRTETPLTEEEKDGMAAEMLEEIDKEKTDITELLTK